MTDGQSPGASPGKGAPDPAEGPREPGSRWILERSAFPAFLSAIAARGYAIVGPTVRDGAIVYGPITSEQDLPLGWTDRQEPGSYRLERRSDGALFGYLVGPHSWKKYLFPPRERLLTLKRSEAGFDAVPPPRSESPTAYLGVRACELAAIRIQDRVFLGGAAPDPGYAARRKKVFLVAVQCADAGGTCFCASMGTGPGVREGFDLSLSEIVDPTRHLFEVVVGTAEGSAVLESLPLRRATAEETAEVSERLTKVERSMGRTMNVHGLHDLLLTRLEHPEWEAVGSRCLSCTNCTMACPTCFCHATEDVPDLKADQVERGRRWDSCFNLGFSEVHGGSVRTSSASRYRQWLTHKLATWYDQFGSSGCVGCGRCITWCPVGIDLTQEVERLRASPSATTAQGGWR